jgi:UDP-2,3-diacylglucosamine pyrophosphatase LpxH
MPRRAIVLSDTHLGSERADVASLCAFLGSLEPTASRLRLILAGDIVDLWRATDEAAAEAARPVFRIVRELVDDGAIVDWVIGNHDHHLLRSLDGEGSPVLDLLPQGVRFHRPFRRLVQNGRAFVITHGDVYDFYWLPLERMGPLSWVLSPRDIESFYDWTYDLDKDLVSTFDRLGTRGLLLAWIAETWRELWEALRLKAAQDPAFAEETVHQRAAAASAMSAAFDVDPVDVARTLARLELREIWERTDDALRWRRMGYVSPHPSRVNRRRFAGRDEIVTGHFHDARHGGGDGWAVSDCGSWWEGPGEGGSYVEIVDGESRLHHFTTSSRARHDIAT